MRQPVLAPTGSHFMDLITFECSKCRQVLRVGADKAGRQAKYPRCATILQIPARSANSARPKAAPSTPQPQRGRGRKDEDEEEREERVAPRRPARRPRDEEDYEAEEPRNRSRRRPDRDEEDYEEE